MIIKACSILKSASEDAAMWKATSVSVSFLVEAVHEALGNSLYSPYTLLRTPVGTANRYFLSFIFQQNYFACLVRE